MTTAVEWLAEKYDYVYWMVKRDEISPGLAEEWKKHYLEQAKEMEKEQLFLAANISAKEAYQAGQTSMYCGCYEYDGCTTYEEWLYKKFKSEE